ncbi:MAG: phytanoyl-CoA dioxygenase family protein [Omnitrophica WOR_2 bacterium]
MTTIEIPLSRTYETYRVRVEEYREFREKGFLVVRGLVPADDIQEMNDHMDNLLAGGEQIDGARIMKNLGKTSMNPEDWLRVHMLHRLSPIHERFLLHPRILDVLEALIGPDVLALQSMLFFKQPGQPGQGYHQDAYYIPSFPETLCGAWVALTPATVQNGCLWFTPGTQHEPIYPDPKGVGAALTSNLGDLGTIDNASATDESINGLVRVAAKYPGKEVPVEAGPGDVVFFGGHILHRSHTNRSSTARRSFVGHYCNARSFVPWNSGEPYEGESANSMHILARGGTHLTYALPKFGTPCAANSPRNEKSALSSQPMSMMGNEDGMMSPTPHAEEQDTE